MRELDNELKNKAIDYEKLLEYGFTRENEIYTYKTKICDEQFEMIVTVKEHKMTSQLVDFVNEEEYVLVDVIDSTGEFVGKVREEYEKELQNMINKCTNPDVFKSEQAKEIIRYVKEKYHDDLEFLWKKFDNNAIWRNQKSHKWYGILVVLSERKLGIDSDKVIDMIDLRYPKEQIREFIDNDKIYPGYHMNKNSWITIKLDGSVETEEIFALIDNSYKISLEK